MSANMFYRDDVCNALMGVQVASALSMRFTTQAEADAFRLGFQSAIASAAISFGIKPEDVRVSLGELALLAANGRRGA